MSLRVYNTLGGKKEKFEPVEPGKISMYVCGPTVYDSCHIGHARSVVVFDVIARYFRAIGYDVTYVRNFTDVDDKIINKANQLGIESVEVAEKFIQEFYEDMGALNVERATIEPKATENIDEIIRVIEILIGKDMAYAVDGDVYFAVEKFRDYGKLSGRKLEDMEAGARVEVDDRKRNPMDFALWKAAKPNEPAWESPWGQGRPGWHIECSAMSSRFLGETFDIHGGGKDLIFPHHENEIAQSEAAFEQPFAKYWLHNGFVNIRHEKMSKSLGNFLTIKEVIQQYHPEVVRLFLLSHHYRSPIDFTDQALDEAAAGLDKLYALLDRLDSRLGTGQETSESASGELWSRFCDAMNDDFNTAQGIGYLFDSVRNLNRLLDDNPQKLSGEKRSLLEDGRTNIRTISSVLGVLVESPSDYFDTQKTRALEKAGIDAAEVERLVAERSAARKEKDWAAADRIRNQLEEMNIIVEDRPDGPIWKITR